MASVFISYSRADRGFVRRLAQDLTNQVVEVWLDEWRMAVGQHVKAVLDEGIAAYDFFLIVLSKTSIASDWVRLELEIALKKEAANRTGFVLPLLLHQVDRPPTIAERVPVDFTADYDTGLALLLEVLGHVTVKVAADTPRVRVISARRGIATRSTLTSWRNEEAYSPASGSSHRLAMVAFVSEAVFVQAVIESFGEPRAARELTSGAAQTVGELFNSDGISRDRRDIARVFTIVDAGAKMLNAHFRLHGLRWTACKMSLFVWTGEGATVAGVGKTGAVIDTGSAVAYENASFTAKFEGPGGAIDPSVIVRYPLGYLVDGSLTVDQRDVEFPSGASVALTSFALPAHPDDIGPLTGRLSHAELADVPRLLVESHWPPVSDALVSLAHRVR